MEHGCLIGEAHPAHALAFPQIYCRLYRPLSSHQPSDRNGFWRVRRHAQDLRKKMRMIKARRSSLTRLSGG
jgi:hypothetical protein